MRSDFIYVNCIRYETNLNSIYPYAIKRKAIVCYCRAFNIKGDECTEVWLRGGSRHLVLLKFEDFDQTLHTSGNRM